MSGVQGTYSTAPRQSAQAFVPPVTAPVKRTPRINDLMKDPEPEIEPVVPAQNESESSENNAPEQLEPANEVEADEKFKEAWHTMFELLFREIATIYYPLKEMVPSIQHNVIQVKVRNEMMKENFESRVRLALEYLRNNYDPRIDDIRVEVDSVSEPVTKVIYDTQDKMNDLSRENPDLPDFVKILNLSAKDM